MVYLCKCGRIKTASPHRASGTLPWMCDNCRNKPKQDKKELLRSLVEDRPRGETGRRKGLKIPRQ